MSLGPVQVLVLGFGDAEPHPAVRDALARLRADETIRLLDLVVVRKHADGRVERLEDGITAEHSGAAAAELIGLGPADDGPQAPADGDIWHVDDVLPPDSAAAVALVEHRWAIPLRDALREAGALHLADAWVHPLDLAAVGLLAAEEAAAQLSGQV